MHIYINIMYTQKLFVNLKSTYSSPNGANSKLDSQFVVTGGSV